MGFFETSALRSPISQKKRIKQHIARISSCGELLLPLNDQFGDISSIQFISKDGEKRFLKDAKVSGGFCTLGNIEDSNTTFFVEGFATGASVFESLQQPVVICYSAHNLAPVAQIFKKKHPDAQIIFIADNDTSGVGEKAARDAADLVYGEVLVPPMVGDANDYVNAGYDLKELLLGKKPIEPMDPFGTVVPRPIDLNLLPDILREYVADQAELMGVDPGAFAMFALAAAGAVLDHRLQIQPKRYDPTWTEAPRLWIAVIGDPSTMKSPALAKAFAPVRTLEHEADQQYQQEFSAWKEEVQKLKKEDPKPQPPVHKRITVADTTIEKLAEILGKQDPRGIIAVHDELSGWLSSMDAYKGGGIHKDRAAWLSAYNGGALRVDRISRGTLFVDNWSIAVVGGIQPSVLQNYMKVSDHDGLLPRFLVYNAISRDQGCDRYPDMEAEKAYNDLMRHLYEIRPGTTVKLSDAAHKRREQFYQKVQVFMRCCENQFLKAALGKWEGTWARLCLVYHCIDAAGQRIHPSDIEVSGEIAEQVSELMRALLYHAVHFYAGIDLVGDRAQGLAGLILAHNWNRFTIKRDLGQKWKISRSMKPWEIEAVLDRLESYGWILPEEMSRFNDRGKPVAYSVNCRVHQMYSKQAEKEKKRRQEVHEFMQKMRS